MVEGNYQLCR